MKGYKMKLVGSDYNYSSSASSRSNIIDNDKKKQEEKKRLESLVYEEDEVIPTVCSICHAILDYTGLGEYKCPDCGHIEYDSYGLVRSFLERHPGANILQTEKSTGVPRHKIAKMISDERFKVSGGRISIDK